MFLIQLGNIEHGGKTCPSQGVPALFRAHSDAALGGEADETGVRHPERLGHLAREGKVTGVIQNVQLALIIFYRQHSGGDGVSALDFFRVEVTGGVSVRALAQTVNGLGQKQHALGQGGLSVATVAQQANITNVLSSVHKKITPFMGPSPIHFARSGSAPQRYHYTRKKIRFQCLFLQFCQTQQKTKQGFPLFPHPNGWTSRADMEKPGNGSVSRPKPSVVHPLDSP